MPGDPSKPLQTPTPDPTGPGMGAPANAIWDPVQKRWVGAGSAGGPGSGAGGPAPGPTSRPAGTTWDMDQQGWTTASTAPSTAYAAPYGAPTGAADLNGGQGTEGRVGSYDPHVGSGADWGGYVGTNVMGPDGKMHYDATMGGVQADINRFQGLAGAAAHQDAYKNDYTQANQDAAMAAGARQGQDAGIALSRGVAMGGDTAAQQLGRNMLQQGVQSQQAVALSARGGSLAQAAALRQQQNGQGAFMQQGNNQLAAQQANEMAAARNEYSQQASAQRAGDAAAQGLHQEQATSQMHNELGQRGLNQAGQMGYEGMAQNVDRASQDAALKNHEMDSGIDAAASLRATASAQRDQQQNAALIAAAGSGIAKLGGDSGSTDPNDPYKKAWDSANATSDARAKTGIRSLAAAAAARGY